VNVSSDTDSAGSPEQNPDSHKMVIVVVVLCFMMFHLTSEHS